MTTLPARPGDVLAVHGGGLAGDLIRLGERLEGKPAPSGHVIIVTHLDAMGRWIGIQGQPGGVGLVDCTTALNDAVTRSNNAQPRASDDNQLTVFLAATAKSLGLKYDWVAIAEDTDIALRAPDLAALIDPLWRWPANHGKLPGEVVCSSLAAMLYDLPSVNWAHPALGQERRCVPADWWTWADRQQWENATPAAQ